jgi:hypothetical protein
MSRFANSMGLRNIYPTAPGLTDAAAATGGGMVAMPMGAAAGAAAPTTEAEMAAAVGALGKPISWWFVLLAAIFGSGYLVKRYAGGADFANIKITPFNCFMIGWIALLGIAFWKVVFTRVKVPGLSSLVLSV